MNFKTMGLFIDIILDIKSRFCDTNIECVHTKGEARWCTGPKISECYSNIYDPISLKEVTTYINEVVSL